MARIHRPSLPGATVFLTICLARCGGDLLLRHIDTLREAARRTRHDKPFGIEAWVVLPDHMHCIWTLPEGDADYPNRVGMLKGRFSRALREKGVAPGEGVEREGVVAGRLRPGSERNKDEVGFWQKRFWDHHIRDANDLAAHVAYCWNDPVRHGLVDHPGKWKWSSWHRDRGQDEVPVASWGSPGATAPGYAVGAERRI